MGALEDRIEALATELMELAAQTERAFLVVAEDPADDPAAVVFVSADPCKARALQSAFRTEPHEVRPPDGPGLN